MRALFSTEVPGLRLGWDATALTWLWTCGQKYYRLGVQGVRGVKSKHLVFGQGLHKGLEELHNARWEGREEEECLRRGIRGALEAVGWREEDGSWQAWRSMDKVKNARGMIRALTWYADDLARGEGGKIATAGVEGKPMTEVYTEVGLGVQALTGEEYWLCGNVDRYVTWEDELWRMEVKTTGTDPSAFDGAFWKQWDPNVQIKVYDLLDGLAGRECGGTLLEAHQVGVGFARWGRMPLRVERGREQFRDEVVGKLREMEGWVKKMQGLGTMHTGQALNLAAPPSSAWPRNYTACHDYGGCPFRAACQRGWEGAEEITRGMGVGVWDPRARGD